jgi:hypothetical protein
MQKKDCDIKVEILPKKKVLIFDFDDTLEDYEVAKNIVRRGDVAL